MVFADGSEEEVDLVLLATGYDLVPYVDPTLFDWTDGRPDLYLNIAHRTLDGLYVLGFVELADAAYQRFDDMAQLVVMDAHAHRTGEHLDELRRLRREDHPDLRGGHRYVDSPGTRRTSTRPPTRPTWPSCGTGCGDADPDDTFYPPPSVDLTRGGEPARTVSP